MKNGRRFGAPPKPYTPPAVPQGKINLTDPDSRLVKGMRGWVQGYNAQAATNEQQIVVAAEITVDSPDFGHLEPILNAARNELQAVGVPDTPEVVVADAGYWHQDQMQRIVADGTQVLIPPDSSRRKAPRPGWDGGLYAFMRRVLDTDRGNELYRQRQQLIEPVFAHTKVQPAASTAFTDEAEPPSDRMAPDRRHPQPAQAPPPPDGRRLKTAADRGPRPRATRRAPHPR